MSEGEDLLAQVKENLVRDIAAAQMQSWREGFGKGLEMAEKMAQATLDDPEVAESPLAAVLGLIGALQTAQAQLAAGGPVGGH